MKVETLDVVGLLLNVGAGTLDALNGAPWWAYLFPAIGGGIFGLRLLLRNL